MPIFNLNLFEISSVHSLEVEIALDNAGSFASMRLSTSPRMDNMDNKNLASIENLFTLTLIPTLGLTTKLRFLISRNVWSEAFKALLDWALPDGYVLVKSVRYL